MNRFLLVSLFVLFSSLAAAQTDTTDAGPWNTGGVGTINFSQVGLNNWAAGGQSSLSVLGLANLFANYKNGNNSWNNTLDVTYGLLKVGKERIRKSDDRLDVQTKYGLNASTDWYYSALVNFRSQLTPTYDVESKNLISDFLAPAFVMTAIGMDYKPNERLTIFISPFTGKFTIVQDQGLSDSGAFGVAGARKDALSRIIPGTGERLREEFGAYLNARYRKLIAENITLQTKLDLFSNYLQNPQNIDVNWENLINMKVNKYVSVSIFTHLIYDDDIAIVIDENDDGIQDGKGPRVQFKESIGVGFSYKFN